MTDIQILTKEVKEVKSLLRQRAKVNNWVNGQTMTELTVWDDSGKLRRARENGYVSCKRVENDRGITSILYDLDSIHEKFFK
jgi:hypothetical protein